MKLSSLLKLASICFSLVIMMAVVSHAQSGSNDDAVTTESLKRQTPSGKYIDASSFFRFHGYISLSQADIGRQLGTEPDGTPQILIAGVSSRSGENESGFKNDAALFIGGEPFDGVGSVIEIHFVGDASDPVITEAKVIWDIVETEGGGFTLRSVAGRFWWPFGIHNEEWFSAVNRFSLLSPAASEVVPAHYNEVGILFEGEAVFSPKIGFNYVASVGNGVPGFGLMQNVRATAYDDNGNRTITGRAGLIFEGKYRTEIGFSMASGDLRATDDLALAASDPLRYTAAFSAYGPDLTISGNGFDLRSYYYQSKEKFSAAGVSGFDRSGMTIEPAYQFDYNRKGLHSLSFQARYSFAEEDRFSSTMQIEQIKRNQYGIGLTYSPTNAYHIKLSYVKQEEGGALANYDNDVLALVITGEF